MQTLEDIKREILSCKKCELYKTKTNYVVGSGRSDAEIVFVGEAPGREEDIQGEPFVGAAGKLLTDMLSMIGLSRRDVFICNVLKCRPPNNRDPLQEEIAACGNYLLRQLAAIRPSLVVCLGRYAASFLFSNFSIEFPSMSKVKGKIFEIDAWGKKVKIYPIYHPAAVLYRPQLRDEYFESFKKIGELAKKRQKTLSDF